MISKKIIKRIVTRFFEYSYKKEGVPKLMNSIREKFINHVANSFTEKDKKIVESSVLKKQLFTCQRHRYRDNLSLSYFKPVTFTKLISFIVLGPECESKALYGNNLQNIGYSNLEYFIDCDDVLGGIGDDSNLKLFIRYLFYSGNFIDLGNYLKKSPDLIESIRKDCIRLNEIIGDIMSKAAPLVEELSKYDLSLGDVKKVLDEKLWKP